MHSSLAGRLRCACDLVSQYLPRDVYEQLLSSYECVSYPHELRRSLLILVP